MGTDKYGELLLPNGGYRRLKSFQLARLIYDITVHFVEMYISVDSRTRDHQMVQAARSGVQNIAEGSVDAATSTKLELNLYNVARASLEELRLDYEDYLRQHNESVWCKTSPLYSEFVARRIADKADFRAFIRWAETFLPSVPIRTNPYWLQTRLYFLSTLRYISSNAKSQARQRAFSTAAASPNAWIGCAVKTGTGEPTKADKHWGRGVCASSPVLCRQTYMPSSRLAFLNASTAKSMSAKLCAAESWTRMRALPFGTTG